MNGTRVPLPIWAKSRNPLAKSALPSLVPHPASATRTAFTMGKTLIIAEKPSVMTDLSRALAKPLGKFEKEGSGRDVYYENDQAVITSAVGHLVELRMPMGPNGKKLPWNFQVLPAIPEHFRPRSDPGFRGPPQAGPQARQAQGHRPHRQRLRRRPRGRTHLPLHHGHRQNPETRAAALDAVDDQQRHPRSLGTPPQRRADAPARRCREVPLRVRLAGRPQRHPRPHLLQLAPRRLQHHRRRPRADAHARHPRRPRGGNPGVQARRRISKSTPPSASQAGEYLGKWIDEAWKKDEANPHGRPERIWEQATAEAIKTRCEGKTGIVSEEKKAQSQIAPQLYDLTTLQREAPFSAKGTLQIAQALYEKHKVITYPRTDSRYLPEDYTGNVRETMQDIANSDLDVARYAAAVLKGGRASKAARASQVAPDFRQQESLRSLRHHPHRQDRQAQRHRAEGV